MTGADLRGERTRLGLTQAQAARRWRVSQTYLSLMEHGKRPVPDRVARVLARGDQRMATALPFDDASTAPGDLPSVLGTLGYAGFEYLANPRWVRNPAAVALAAVRQPTMAARVTEALPWLFATFPHLDWDWLLDQVRLSNCQNRLGYLVGLAQTLARRRGDQAAFTLLLQAGQRLEEARLVREDTLGRLVTNVERSYLRTNRPAEAAHWNLLTTLRAEDLRYAD